MKRHTYPVRRMFIVMIGVTSLLVTIWLQVVRWQVLYAREQPRGEGNVYDMHMGTIVDSLGMPLAFDAPTYTLTVDKRQLQPEELPQVQSWLISLGIPEEEVRRTLQQDLDTVEFRHLPYEVAQAARKKVQDIVERRGRLWLRVDTVWIRSFPQGRLAAHVLGFRNWASPPQLYGGVHEFYQSFLLRGEGLQPEFARPGERPGGISPYFPSPYERDLVLTLHTGVQYWVEQELDRAVERYQARGGVVIVMDPWDGRILAMASRPTFDPNTFYLADPKAWTNRAVSEAYEPGSVVKALTFAAAVDSGVVTETTTIMDTGIIQYGPVVIRNAQRKAYGRVTPEQILAYSLNVPTAHVASMLGPETFYRYMDLFGFAQLTEVDLANEVAGSMRHPRDPTWNISDLASNSFGQGMNVTPIQLIRAMAVIANGGVTITPHVLQGYEKDGVYWDVQWPHGARIIKESTARTLTRWLTAAVEHISVPDRASVPVAGKTGTAQVPDLEHGGYKENEQNVTFVGYFPADHPQVIMLVYLESPKKGPLAVDPNYIWAFNTAYPTFVRIADHIVPLLDISGEDGVERNPGGGE